MMITISVVLSKKERYGANEKNDCRHAIIADCSRVGAEIASILSSRGKVVVVLDNNKLSFRKLSPDYSGFTVEADATDVDALKHAGIEKADLLVAATNDDNTNIRIAQIATKLFQVPRKDASGVGNSGAKHHRMHHTRREQHYPQGENAKTRRDSLWNMI